MTTRARPTHEWVPPHTKAERVAAEQEVIACARNMVSGRIPRTSSYPSPLASALDLAVQRLSRIEQDNADWREARRLANLARLIHLVANPGDKTTVCGLETKTTPAGWGRPDFVASWRQLGQNICADCLPDGSAQPPTVIVHSKENP